MDTIPLFDFHAPWVALIQLALVYFLPRLTGLVTDRWTASGVKIGVLGVLSVLASTLTWLLDVAVANSWATLDWVALINVAVNAALTFAVAQGVFKGVIVPLGQADRDAKSNVIKLFKADPARVKAEATAPVKGKAA